MVQKQAPAIPTVYLTLQKGSEPTNSLDKATEWTAGFNPAELRQIAAAHHQGGGRRDLVTLFRDVDAALVSEVSPSRSMVVVWTVNTPEDMAWMIDIGVDGVISDHPDLLRKIAGEKGIALPAGHPVTP